MRTDYKLHTPICLGPRPDLGAVGKTVGLGYLGRYFEAVRLHSAGYCLSAECKPTVQTSCPDLPFTKGETDDLGCLGQCGLLNLERYTSQ